jgi:hypothetical protein
MSFDSKGNLIFADTGNNAVRKVISCPDSVIMVANCPICFAGSYWDSTVKACQDCKENTFSSYGSTGCTPCPTGLVSGANSSTCSSPSLPLGAVVGIAIVCIVILILLAISSYYAFLYFDNKYKSNRVQYIEQQTMDGQVIKVAVDNAFVSNNKTTQRGSFFDRVGRSSLFTTSTYSPKPVKQSNTAPDYSVPEHLI